ncbi:FMN-binding glutamate synthase family protein [Zobellia galactanivorans]|uniref:FMN / Fe-S cluster binding protein n=1 Tax=Zobellia galactanivorans (strain DSM 12802 / CCUG 47099 / CIP 106680 / NCIMB 13871 / Dsij) TaxID=63186 RepID=G0L789_ZOBGA|nr:FMN-binding glutamate synthase family protein [Zobellia galactanivorans]CAZ97225.1 FMN / Fe-S cluster binding protein [Zobellia galactanivorans]
MDILYTHKVKRPVPIARLDELKNNRPTHAFVNGLELTITKKGKQISVFYDRSLYQGTQITDRQTNKKSINDEHGVTYFFDTETLESDLQKDLHRFVIKVDKDYLYVDEVEINDYLEQHPQHFYQKNYLENTVNVKSENTETDILYVKELAKNNLNTIGSHGFSVSMGIDRNTLPKWSDIQFLPAQLARKPLSDDQKVSTKVVIGPNAQKPLVLDIPIIVSDISFGTISREAKIALSKGAEMAGTGICSGEGGMLWEEQRNNTNYFYELGAAKFGFSWDKLSKVQAFHFKGGQGAKTGISSHLPGSMVSKEIADVLGIEAGKDAVVPATFPDLNNVADFKAFSKKVQKIAGGIPIGFKIAASHIEKDIQFALDVGVDYIILDGRGGGTGSAPAIIRNNINVPTIPALVRARKYLDLQGATDVTLIITGGLRTADDFFKALMLGADVIAVASAAMYAIGCIGIRACNSNNCPVGIATQKKSLRNRLIIESAAQQLCNYFEATNALIKVIARTCGYDDISKFNHEDLSTFNSDMYKLTGIKYAGIHP